MQNPAPSPPIKANQRVAWNQLPRGHRFSFLGVRETCLKTGDRTYQDGKGFVKTFAFSQTMNVTNLTEA
jgi:hypothetical protein